MARKRHIILSTIFYPGAYAFRCDGGMFGAIGARNLPDSYFNDDYCDCKDLSDEPATNACALLTTPASSQTRTPMFSCRDTKGYSPFDIPSHQKGDGVCDCCDGSDEPPASGCVDHCAVWAAEAEKKRVVREAAMAAGKGKFEKYSASGLKALQEREVSLGKAREELVRLEGLENEAAARKEGLLAKEADERESRRITAEAELRAELNLSDLPLRLLESSAMNTAAAAAAAAAAAVETRVELLLRLACAHNDTGVESLMGLVVDRLSPSLTDKMDDVEVLARGTLVSQAMFTPQRDSSAPSSAEEVEGGGEGGGEGGDEKTMAAAGVAEAKVGPDGEAVVELAVPEKKDGSAVRVVGMLGASPTLQAALTEFGQALFLAKPAAAAEADSNDPPWPPAMGGSSSSSSGSVQGEGEGNKEEEEAAAASLSPSPPAELQLQLQQYSAVLEAMVFDLATAKELRTQNQGGGGVGSLRELVSELRRGPSAGVLNLNLNLEGEGVEGGGEEVQKAAAQRFVVPEEAEDAVEVEDWVGFEVEDWDSWRWPEAMEAENDWREAGKSVKAVRVQVKALEAQGALHESLGASLQYHPLSQACYATTVGGFEYQVCPFKDAKQDHTSLGTFSKWKEGGNQGDRVMVFENGAKCWNGPKRSLEVTMKCGSADAVSDVEEPETCVYVASMTTPAACGKF